MHNNFEIEQYEKIHYYKNVLKNPTSFIELVEDTDILLNSNTSVEKWKWWRRPSDNYGKIKNIKPSILKETNPLLVSINQRLMEALIPTIDHYNSIYNYNITKDFMYGDRGQNILSINKYFKDANLPSHVDSFGDINSPVLTTVLYLNNDYEGGEIEFKNQGVCIKPEAGSLIIFPSTPPYYHESKKIINGTKYMVLKTWFDKSILNSIVTKNA
jgi:hypothetical protein